MCHQKFGVKHSFKQHICKHFEQSNDKVIMSDMGQLDLENTKGDSATVVGDSPIPTEEKMKPLFSA